MRSLRGRILSVNLAEVMGRADARRHRPLRKRPTPCWPLPLTVIDLDPDLAIEAGAMDCSDPPFGLSLGDRACLALASREGLPAMTADRSWLQSGALGRGRGQADPLTAQPCRYSFIALLKKKSRRCCSGSGIGSTCVGSS